MPRLGSGVPLVGRRRELSRLRESLAAAARGEACGVLVYGDAGVGKTRLIAELGHHAEAEGALVLTGRCLDMAEGGLPYLPFADALAPLTATSDPQLAAVVRARPALGRLLPQLVSAPVSRSEGFAAPVEPEAPFRARREQDLNQLQLFEAVLGVLSELAARRLTVLILEDLHWADSSTRDLLTFLLSRLRGQRLLVVASYRQEDVHRKHPLRPLLAQLARIPALDRLELRPFDPPDAQDFVGALSDEPLPPDVVASIVERSEGNAFFAEELLASCAERGDGMPSALADVLLSRLERLSPLTQRVVRTASVADGAVSHTALAEVTDVGELELDEALREAVQHHILVVEGRYYTFRHALLREAVYGDLLPGERTRLHAAYAARLIGRTDRGDQALLAYHSLESNDLPTALAASLAAAEEAERLGAPAAALRHVEQALRIWDAVPAPQRPAGVEELELTRTASRLAGASGGSRNERSPSRGRRWTRCPGRALRLVPKRPRRCGYAWRRRCWASTAPAASPPKRLNGPGSWWREGSRAERGPGCWRLGH